MSRSSAKVIIVLPDSSHLDHAINASVCLSVSPPTQQSRNSVWLPVFLPIPRPFRTLKFNENTLFLMMLLSVRLKFEAQNCKNVWNDLQRRLVTIKNNGLTSKNNSQHCIFMNMTSIVDIIFNVHTLKTFIFVVIGAVASQTRVNTMILRRKPYIFWFFI